MSSTNPSHEPAAPTAVSRRMSAEQRRELVLEAATRAFARGGYAGTSTDVVAQEAGVSQPYVVRIFGTKLELFLLVLQRSVDRIRLSFEAVIAASPFDAESDGDWERLSLAYFELLKDRDFLQVMMHGFVASSIEEIGEVSRRCMGDVFGALRATGADDDRIRDFIAYGMLLNIMALIGAPEHAAGSDSLAALTQCSFGDALPELVAHRSG